MRRIAAALLFAASLFAAKVPGRYIVELSTEPVADAVRATRQGLRSSAANRHRDRVRAEQDGVRKRIEARQARVLDSIETAGNALFVQANEEQAAALAAMPGVRRVFQARTFKRNLDRAAQMHRVAEAWSRVGRDRAGEGVKIAIVDSGIEVTHAAFQDPSMKAPDSFPRFSTPADAAFTNGKVIVARSYVNLLAARDPDTSARDHSGHGTALAMAAAGARVAGPLATIEGVAPRAWLGSYKVFGSPGINDEATDDAILKAIDDAVADGMDVINLSFGSDFAPRLEDDIEVSVIERASKLGVLFVVSAGNNGPEATTIGSPATAPSALAVGAATNDRTFAASVDVVGMSPLVATVSSSTRIAVPVTAALADVARLDGDGLACAALPAGSLAGKIALIGRGTCTFEVKLTNAQRAGATAALIHAAESAPGLFSIGAGAATLPAEAITWADGQAIRQALAANAQTLATMRFTQGAVPQAGGQVAGFSSGGPNVDLSIKPDLMAVGADFYTATQTFDPRGDMYSANGFTLVDGTSFSAPFTAGAAAVLKSARPGLTVDQYRSLLMNTAAEAPGGPQRSGAGMLDLDAAVRSTVTAYPASIGFALTGAAQRPLTLTNLSAEAETFSVEAVPSAAGQPAPEISGAAVTIPAGGSVEVAAAFPGGLAPGGYSGAFVVRGSAGSRIRVPYWFAVSGGPAVKILVLSTTASGRRAGVLRDAVLFRVLDSAGLALSGFDPELTAVSGGGVLSRLRSYDSEIPGLFGLDVVLGPVAGANVFELRVGPASVRFTVTGR